MSRSVRLIQRWLALALMAGLVPLACAQTEAHAQVMSLAWSGLTAQQHQALAPLASQWDRLPVDSRRKWLEMATRFPAMPQQQQQRVQERMTEWARLSPEERSKARVNFQQTQQLSAQDRQAQWEAYSALSPQEREALAAQARKTVPAPPTQPLRAAPVNAQAPKSNLVKPPATSFEMPKPVAPSLIQSGAGATTSLVTSRPAPPVHQLPGQPKITAASDQVDRATLLPKPKPPATPPGATTAVVPAVPRPAPAEPSASPSGASSP